MSQLFVLLLPSNEMVNGGIEGSEVEYVYHSQLECGCAMCDVSTADPFCVRACVHRGSCRGAVCLSTRSCGARALLSGVFT